MSEITRHDRGWPGHFIGVASCLFRRNTLVSDEVQNRHIVVSTVGAYRPPALARHQDGPLQPIGFQRFYETMCFIGAPNGVYIDAEAGRQIDVGDVEWAILASSAAELPVDVDIRADAMHEGVVAAVMRDFHSIYERAIADREAA